MKLVKLFKQSIDEQLFNLSFKKLENLKERLRKLNILKIQFFRIYMYINFQIFSFSFSFYLLYYILHLLFYDCFIR